MHKSLFLLSNSVNPADCLQLLCWIEKRFRQNDVAGFDQVEAIGSLADWHEEDFDIFTILQLQEY